MTQTDYTQQLTNAIKLHGEHSPEVAELMTIGIFAYGFQKYKEILKQAKQSAQN